MYTLVRYIFVEDTKSASNGNIVVKKSDGCVCIPGGVTVSYGRDQ